MSPGQAPFWDEDVARDSYVGLEASAAERTRIINLRVTAKWLLGCRSTRLDRGSASRWPAVYLTVRRPGRRCRVHAPLNAQSTRDAVG